MDTKEHLLEGIDATLETLMQQVKDLEFALKQSQKQEGPLEKQYENSLAIALIEDLRTIGELAFCEEKTEDMHNVFARVSRAIVALKGIRYSHMDDIFRALFITEIRSVMISGGLDLEEEQVLAELYTRRTNGPEDETNSYSKKAYARLSRKLGTNNLVSLASLPDQHIHLEDVLLNKFKSLEIGDDLRIQEELQKARLQLIDSLVNTLEKQYVF
jgi:uncharacterized protein YdcH (DUF465 family)